MKKTYMAPTAQTITFDAMTHARRLTRIEGEHRQGS